MTYRAEAFLQPAAASDREQLRQLGWLRENAPEPIAAVDPLDEEGHGAVMVFQHPEMLIAQDRQLWRVVDEWMTGVRRAPARGDSNWVTVALSTMSNAHAREQARRIKRGVEG